MRLACQEHISNTDEWRTEYLAWRLGIHLRGGVRLMHRLGTAEIAQLYGALCDFVPQHLSAIEAERMMSASLEYTDDSN